MQDQPFTADELLNLTTLLSSPDVSNRELALTMIEAYYEHNEGVWADFRSTWEAIRLVDVELHYDFNPLDFDVALRIGYRAGARNGILLVHAAFLKGKPCEKRLPVEALWAATIGLYLFLNGTDEGRKVKKALGFRVAPVEQTLE